MSVKPFLLAVALASALTGMAPAAPAQAQSLEPNWIIPAQGRGRGGPEQSYISAREAIERARQALRGGEPIGQPRLDQSGGRPCYVLLWLFPDEVRREVRVDAVSGAVYG